MEGKHRRIGFRILSSTLSGAEITRRVGLEATHLGEAGQALTHHLAAGPVRRETVWVLDSPLPPPAPVEERLEALLDVLEPRERQVSLLTYDCLMHVFIGSEPVAHADHPILLAPELLARLAAVPGEGVLIEAVEAPHERPGNGAGPGAADETLPHRHHLLHRHPR